MIVAVGANKGFALDAKHITRTNRTEQRKTL